MTTRPRPRFMRCVALCVALCLGAAPGVQAVELISAEQVVQHERHGTAAGDALGDVRTRLATLLDRDDVAASLAARGVSAEQAHARVAALTDDEAAWLLAEIDRAPAGAGGEIIGTAVLVFVVLVFSDILGFTHIFPFLRKAR